MGKAIAKNPNITDLFGVCDVLRAIDLERMQPMGLKGKFVAYMFKPTYNQKFTARFEGPLEAECLKRNGVYREYGNYRLPKPTFIRLRHNEKNEYITDRMPYEMTWSHPAYIELILRAEYIGDFEGFLGAPYLIRDMVDNGWNRRNPDHTSIMWFHLAKEDVDSPDSAMLSVSGYGLEIYRTNIDDIQIFTTADMERFLELGKKKD